MTILPLRFGYVSTHSILEYSRTLRFTGAHASSVL
jgi:hypothetical protein